MDNNKTLSNPETASNKAPSKLTFIYYDEDEFAAFLDSLPLTVASKVIARIREVSTIGIAEAMTLQLVKKEKISLSLELIRKAFSPVHYFSV